MVTVYPDQETIVSPEVNPFEGKNWETVTAVDFVLGYRNLGFYPVRSILRIHDGDTEYACAIGVLRSYLLSDINHPNSTYWRQFPADFEYQMACGFDGRAKASVLANTQHSRGFRLGQEIARLVF